MAEHHSDEEQAEALKKWLDENKNSLLGSIILSLVVIFGYQGWQTSVTETGEAASSAYEDMAGILDVSPLESLTEEQLSTIEHLGSSLKEQHQSSVYSVFAALHLAKLAVEKDDLDRAEAELRWALEHAPEDSIAQIAGLRLARVVLSKGEPEEALKIIEQMKGVDGFSSINSEIRGDILVSQGSLTEAREAYQQALDTLVEGADNPILEMKLSNLPLNAVDETVVETASTETTDENDL